MKHNDPPPTLLIPIPSSPSSSSSSSSSTTTPPTTTTTGIRRHSSSLKAATFLNKTRYKFWVLAAILLLAFWSMFTGSVTLKWSAHNLTSLSDNFDLSTFDDLDILEVEEREKVVRRMWDLYSHSTTTSTSRLPRFWQEAFRAAYEHLSSDVPAARNAAVSEIAKMSIRSINTIDASPLQKKSNRELKKRSKKAEESKEVTTAASS